MKKSKKKGAHREHDAEQAAGHGGRAHGIAPVEPTDLPATRGELLALHALERRRRSAAALGDADYRAAGERLAEIEIQIARVERRADPPQV
jgi:hypothetical protein